MKISKKLLLIILLTISLTLGFLIFNYFIGLPIAIIYLMLWFDKVLLAQLKFHGKIGIELISIPIILTGIIYGPVFGFIFGFLILAFIEGFLNIISWSISPPLEMGWIPFIPSIDTLKEGLSGAIAGVLWNYNFPFLITVLICIVFRNVFAFFKDKLTGAWEENIITYPLNIFYNLILAFLLQNYFLIIINL